MAGWEESDRRGIAFTLVNTDSGARLQVGWSKKPGGLAAMRLELRHKPSDEPAIVTWDLDPDDAEELAAAFSRAAREAREAAQKLWGSS